jgi:TRAP-type C4-dicarboxylate transport system substrate-binding protein
MFTRSKILLSAALAVSIIAFTGAARATTYKITFAGGHGTHLPWMKAIKEFYIPEVDKRLAAAGGKDKIVWTEAFGGTLAKIGGVLEAVQEGVADMGMVYTIFEPAKLPLMSVTFLAPFGSDDVTLISKIIVEMNAEMPELKAHWAKQNQVFLGAIAADTDHTWTKFPVKTLEDYKGRKLGASGSLSLWANGIGAVAVQGDFATHYNNVKTGVYDGLIAFTTGVYPIKIHEVAPYMTKVDLGSMSIGAITINKKLFDSMSPETQKIMRDVGVEYSQRVSATMKNLAGVFEKKMAAEGAKISVFPPAERKKWATTMPNIAKDWVKRNEARGIPAKKVLEAYMSKLRAAHVELVRDWDKE